jgi:hypothetical protein
MRTVIDGGVEFEIVWTGERIITEPVIPQDAEKPVLAVIQCAQCGKDKPITRAAFKTLTRFCGRNCSQLHWRMALRATALARKQAA